MAMIKSQNNTHPLPLFQPRLAHINLKSSISLAISFIFFATLRFYTSDTLSILMSPETSSESTNLRLIQFPIERAEGFYRQIPLTAIRPSNASLPDEDASATKLITNIVDAVRKALCDGVVMVKV